MPTLAVRVPHARKAWSPFGGVARVASVMLTVIDVFAEAQRLADEAQRRYPFTVWDA